MPKYKVTITEIKDVSKTETESFIVEERPLTDAEVAEHYRQYYAEGRERQMKKVYGTHKVDSTSSVETKIYEQTVNALDIAEVVKVINHVRSV